MAEFKRFGNKNFGSRDRDSGSSRPKRPGARSADSGRNFGGSRRGSEGGPRRDSGRSFSRSDSRGTGPELHEVTCDKCGKSCEVPFRPTSNKPVYCSDCFRKDDSGSGTRNRRFEPENKPGISSDELDAIHKKLDKILRILNADQE